MNLQQIQIPIEELNRRKREMSHWNAVAKKLYSTLDLEEILKILITEIHGLSRPYIVRRIYAHYNNIRRKQDLEAIANYIKETRNIKA